MDAPESLWRLRLRNAHGYNGKIPLFFPVKIGYATKLFMDQKTEPGSNGKFAESTVYIWNMSEDVWPFICAMTDDRVRQAEISENASLAERELFSFAGSDHILYVTPRPISAEFLSYYTELFGKKDLEILVTKRHTGVTSDDVRKDTAVMDAIMAAGRRSKRLMFASYSTSFQFLKLVSEVRKLGIEVFTPEAPEEEDAWTVNFYGSKSGIRQLAQKSSAIEPDFKMAEGVVCDNITDAAKIAAKRYRKSNGVVIKTNKGHSGAGVMLFQPGELPTDYHECEREILKKLKEEAYWDRFPIIIEDLIQINSSVGGGSPSVEFRIFKSGRVDFLYFCGMSIDKDGIFHGVEINQQVVSDKIAAQLVDTGFFIAEQYAAEGYRGYFDVDFVAAKNGTMYVTESNVRRTGGTYVYHVAEHLLGKDFMYQSYVLSHTSYELPQGKHYHFVDVIEKLRPVLFDKKLKEGVIVVSENTIELGKLAYIIIARNKKRALEIQEQLQQIITS